MNGKSVLGSNCRSAVPTLTLTLLKHKSIILSIHIICIILQKMHNGTKDREPSPLSHIDNTQQIDYNYYVLNILSVRCWMGGRICAEATKA